MTEEHDQDSQPEPQQSNDELPIPERVAVLERVVGLLCEGSIRSEKLLENLGKRADNTDSVLRDLWKLLKGARGDDDFPAPPKPPTIN